METTGNGSPGSSILPNGGLPILIRLALGAMGGFFGAVLAAVIWGLVVFFTETEFSFLAIGVGFLAGVGVLLGSLGSRGWMFQFLAVDFSLLGLALGYYASFYAFARDFIAENYGAEYASNVGVFSPATLSLFIESLPNLIDPFTLIWAVIAVITAWGVPRRVKS